MASRKRNAAVRRAVEARLEQRRAVKNKRKTDTKAKSAGKAKMPSTAKPATKAKAAKAPPTSRPSARPPRSPPTLKRGQSAKDLLAAATVQTRKTVQTARADLQQAKKLLGRIRQDFYDVGEILTRLKEPAAYRALRYESFADLVTKELDMSLSVANRLVSIVESVSRELALEVGQSHAYALVSLAQATAEEDTPEELATKTLKLPTGETLHIPTASVRAKNAAAAAIRKSQGGSKRGNTTSPEDRKIAKEIEASLRALGVKKAKVRAKPTRPGDPAELEIKGVPMSALDELCRAICPE